jgi:hypothetical protein
LKILNKINMSEGIRNIGTAIGAIMLGEIVGGLSREISNRVKVHRAELGGPIAGDGSGRFDTLLDLTLNVSVEAITLLLGIKLVEAGFPSVTSDLHSMIFFILGISAENTDLVVNLRQLTDMLVSETPNPASQ